MTLNKNIMNKLDVHVGQRRLHSCGLSANIHSKAFLSYSLIAQSLIKIYLLTHAGNIPLNCL